MSNLTVFSFDSNKVRVLIIDKKPWFVAKDLASVLGYSGTGKMLTHVDDEDKDTKNPQDLDDAKIAQSFGDNTFRVSLINESGMYAVIFNSTKAEAKKFKRWVTSEVLPSIRETGSYHSQLQPQPQKCLTFAEKLEGVREVENLMGNFATQHPRLAQELTDVLMNELKGQRLLTGSSEPVLRGVVEIAEEMGYRAHDLGIRSTLGKFVKKMVGHLSQYEKRLCNGTMKDINCYPDTPEVRDAIAKFFS